MFKKGINIYVLALNAYSIKNILKYFYIKKKKYIYSDGGIKTYIINYLNIFPRLMPLFFYYSAIILRRNYYRILKENSIKFDLVHIHSAINAGIFYHLSKIPIKSILTEHATFYSQDLFSFWEKFYLPRVFSSVSKLIAVGNGLKRDMSKYTKKDISIIFNMAKITDYTYQIDKHKIKFRFFSLGLGLHKKGFDILISAYSKSKIMNITELYIAGLSHNEIAILQEMLSVLQLKNVKLLGNMPREEVAYNMYNCDCFILPSRFETFGIVFAEAMYFGKPVIASITGGPDSFVIPETGILVPVENIEATTHAIEEIYFNREKYNEDYIREYARKNFSPDSIAQKIIDEYCLIK